MVVGKKTLKDYGFYSIEDYFNYILDSEINGQYSQVKDLFKKLNKDQKRLFMAYIQDNEGILKNKFDLRTLF